MLEFELTFYKTRTFSDKESLKRNRIRFCSVMDIVLVVDNGIIM